MISSAPPETEVSVRSSQHADMLQQLPGNRRLLLAPKAGQTELHAHEPQVGWVRRVKTAEHAASKPHSAGHRALRCFACSAQLKQTGSDCAGSTWQRLLPHLTHAGLAGHCQQCLPAVLAGLVHGHVALDDCGKGLQRRGAR